MGEDTGVVQTCADEVTLAGLLATQQSSHDLGQQVVAGNGVTNAGGGRNGLVQLVQGGHIPQETASGPVSGGVEGGGVGLGAGFAEAQDHSIDQLGEAVLQIVVGDAQTGQRIQTGIGQEYVGVLQQLEEDFLAFLALKVDGDQFLAGVVDVENGVLFVAETGIVADAELTPAVAAGMLDLNDASAQVRQQSAADGSGNKGRQINDFVAFQRFAHSMYLTLINYILSNRADTPRPPPQQEEIRPNCAPVFSMWRIADRAIRPPEAPLG